ncbi:MAG TPA: DUF11 domain-containing protein, partial [Gaiellaceae bacterium]|nr:DUF11 domain-containing protein [Gaiellaceae bacterium]
MATQIILSDKWVPADFTQVGDFLWGALNNTLQRLDPQTGQVDTFQTNLFTNSEDGAAGAVFTYGNGNLGISSSNTGVVSQVAIGNPGSSSPTFTLVSQSPGPQSHRNDGASCTPHPNITDLSIVKSGPANVLPESTITWTLTVTNAGPAISSGFTVKDTVPVAVTNVASSTPGCSVSGNDVTCVGPSLGVDESFQIALTGTAPATNGACVQNFARILANEQDDNERSASVQTCVAAELADLSIVKSRSPSPAVPGTNETFTLRVKNGGPDAAQDAVVSDPLPAGLSFVSAASGCSFANATVTCRLNSLASGASTSFTVVAHVASSVPSGIVNTAQVDSSTADPDPSNNSSTVSAPIGPAADLAITKSASVSTIAPGGQLVYTLVVSNNGPSDDDNVVVSDPLPGNLSLVTALPSQGSCIGGADIICSLGALAVGGSVQVLVAVQVASSFS